MQDHTLTPAEFELFRRLIHRMTGISLNDGKRQLVQSRLQRRLRHHGLKSFSAYYEMVKDLHVDDPEMRPFVNCVTTNKTDFFRENHHFELVKTMIVPELIDDAARGRRDRTLRVWHAGCSTGEEPYSLAITLREAFASAGGWTIRQLASDIDTDVLASAEAAVYEESRVEPVPPTLLRKYFLRRAAPDGFLYKVRNEIADQVAFRQINLLEDRWPIRSDVQFDIIFCRNVVIYFDKPTQQQLFQRFAERLAPGGYLFIGHSETLIGVSNAYDAVGQTVYRLKDRMPLLRTA